MLALKLANLLETHGKCGNIVLVDGSPKFVNDAANQMIPKDHNDEYILGLILSTCIKFLFPESVQEVSKKIFSHSSLNERVQAFLEIAATRSEYSIDYGRQMIEGLMKRIYIVLNVASIKFEKLNKSQMILVKASESSVSGMDKDYGLKKLVEGEIKISVADGNHVSILTGLELIDILNSFL